MSNILTIKPGNPDLFHAEATPHGVNIMTRNDAGMYEHVAIITYESAVSRLDAGEYDDTPDTRSGKPWGSSFLIVASLRTD